MVERRSTPRIEPRQPLSARVKAFLPARIVDLSSRGVQIELATSLRPEVPCDLRITLDQGEVVVRGIVRRCRAWGFGLDERDQRVLLYRAGLEFGESAPEALIEVVSSVLEAAVPETAPGDGEVPQEAAEAAAESVAREPGPVAAPAVAPTARAPHGGGRVKIRISSESVRRVLGGAKKRGE